MENQSIDQIKRKTILGVITLIIRTQILQLIAGVGNFLLSVFLSPAIFGIYWVVTAIIAVLNYFSDIGLAGALVQKKEEPTREDYITTFTIQLLLVVTAIIIFFIISDFIASFLNLNSNGVWLFKSLLISFFLSSLKTIPSIMLERELEFGKKIIPQILETFTLYLVAIILALRGFGILSFAYAALARGLIGVVAMYLIQPWKPSLGIYIPSAKRLLSFGIPLQGGSILALFKDDLLTIYLGKVLSQRPEEIGFIGWAKKNAEIPLRNFMDSITGVAFPVYSRIAHDKEILRKGIEKTLFFTSLLIFPTAIGLILIIKPIMLFIPNDYFSRWQGALLSFYFFSISSILASLSSPLVQVLNALGKAKTTFFLMLFWTVITWLLVPVMVGKIGYNGVAFSSFIISLSAFLPMMIIRRYVQFNFIRPLITPTLGSIIMGLLVGVSMYFTGSSLWGIGLSIVIGALSYFAFIYTFSRSEILPFIQLLFKKKPAT